jgi:hypothetical protein
MGLLDAQEYDPRPAQRRWRMACIAAALVFVFLAVWFWPSGRFRYRHQWSIANKFFQAIEHRDFDAAYGLYNGDPEWKQHREKYKAYPLSRFELDWGPSGDLNIAQNHEVDCATEPPKKGFASASGIAVVVTVNHRRTDPTILWVEKKSDTITTSPWDFEAVTRDSPMVRAFCQE